MELVALDRDGGELGIRDEAAHAAVRTPGPLRGFYLRVERRRGTGVAVVAVARKLAVLAWHLLTHDADYTWSPALRSAEKVRAMERLAGDPKRLSRRGTRMGGPGDARARRGAARARERAGLELAQAAYEQFVAARGAKREAVAAKGERLDGPAEPGPAAPRS